jgi:agmatine deiminase
MTSGFAMPAEWAPHRRTWIAWPHERSDWPGKFEPIPWVAAEIVRRLVEGERVGILVRHARERAAARALLRRATVDLGRVDFLVCPTDRSWTRDSGPTFVRDRAGRRRAVCWRFNAWAKYSNYRRDARVAAAIARRAGVEAVGVPAVMEGGAIDVDGHGTLLATEECLLSRRQARNPGLDRAGVERLLGEALGARRVVWLGRGIAGDDTHGHVDDVARFTAPGRVVLCQEKNRRDPNWRPLQENRERLRAAGLEVVPLPMPEPLLLDGVRLPASYANFYVANGTVLVPTFNDPADRRALGVLAEQFPGRRVVGIHAVDFVWGFGTIHCATQQEPEGC